MRTLEKITIKGFKSIREQTLELDRLNVFIGGNGAGKSNLIGAFRFLHEVANQRLSRYVATRGSADNILHFGRKTTPKMEFILEFGDGANATSYQIVIGATDEDELVIASQKADFQPFLLGHDREQIYQFGYSKESKLRESDHIAAQQITRDLDSYQVYHFHDTSDNAEVKGVCNLDDNRRLRPQAENLAAYLFYLQQKHPDHFSLIEDTVKQIAPFFDRFELHPRQLNQSQIRLEWKEVGHDGYFNATAFSDGTLRFICLATLLLQAELPTVILLDEPEPGLHPAAVVLLAEMLAVAASRTQVIVATQSVTLINQLTPEQVWTVNRQDDQSVFTKLDQTRYRSWLDDYSLGELWEKNLLDARP